MSKVSAAVAADYGITTAELGWRCLSADRCREPPSDDVMSKDSQTPTEENFAGKLFEERADFAGHTFAEAAIFNGATFRGGATFEGADVPR